jgi:hypothetical protein
LCVGGFGFVCWLTIAIRIEEKGEGFENGMLHWLDWLAFNWNLALQSLTRLKILYTYKVYESKIKYKNKYLAYR